MLESFNTSMNLGAHSFEESWREKFITVRI